MQRQARIIRVETTLSSQTHTHIDRYDTILLLSTRSLSISFGHTLKYSDSIHSAFPFALISTKQNQIRCCLAAAASLFSLYISV